MKHITILFLVLLVSVSSSGQQMVNNLLKARAEIESGNPDAAISAINRSLAVTRDSRLFTERAEASVLKGDYSSAISDYNEADKLSAGSGEYGLARIYALKGDAATSTYHLALSMKSSFRKPEKEIMLDPAFKAIEKSQEWRQFWKQNWYSTLEKDLSQIEYLTESGKIADARQLLSEIKAGYSDNSEALYAEALVDIADGKYKEAVSILSGLGDGTSVNPKYLRLLAKAQVFSSNAAGASDTYTRLIDSGVADAGLYLKRAECYSHTGESNRALADIIKYLNYYPDNKKAISMAGREEVKSGDNLKALEYFSRNIKLHPGDPECYVDRADSYFISRSWKWAEDDYSMSLDLDPGNPDAWLNKGISLLNEGKTEDACHDFRIAFRLGNKRATDYISRNCIK
ncbi:MAG TPA: tetratricopeptide repeat protein [Bacteroidales bacterium]|nr:tetratricopeptide repeat protein [Bacteroidales bacterium]